MAYFFRVAFILFCYFSLNVAHAVPQVQGWLVLSYKGSFSGATADEACRKNVEAEGYTWGTSVSTGSNSASCLDANGGAHGTAYLELSCPVNSTSAGSSCTCNAGYKESGNQCVPESTAADWDTVNAYCSQYTFGGLGNYIVGKSATSTCVEASVEGNNGTLGCKYEITGDTVSYPVDGEWRTYGTVSASLSACVIGGSTTTEDQNVPTDAETIDQSATGTEPCKNGYSGSVNGTTVCIPFKTDQNTESTTKKTTTGTDANGNATSTETTSKTTCTDGKCSTQTTSTTTTTDKDTGSKTVSSSTTTTTQAKSEYCAANSSKSECIGENSDSSFGGDCASGIQAEGDAIQVAIVKEQYRTRCEIENWDSDLKNEVDVGEAASSSFVDEAASSTLLGWMNTPQQTASCPSPKTLQLLGQTYTLSLQPLCDVAQGIRPVVIAIALLLGLRIAFMPVILR